MGDSYTLADTIVFAELGYLVSGKFPGVPTNLFERAGRFRNIQAVRKKWSQHPAVVAHYQCVA